MDHLHNYILKLVGWVGTSALNTAEGLPVYQWVCRYCGEKR